MLEDHSTDFIETCSLPDHVVYGDCGAESIHKIFRLLQRTYCSMQPATIRLQSMLKKEHYRLVHPDAKALKPVIPMRKWHPKGENSVLPKSICLSLLHESNIRVSLH